MLSRNVESSQLTLAKLFAPIVALNLLKRRNEADTSRALERCLLPTAEGLKASKLLSSWPKHVIQELIDGASLRFHQKGRCIAFGGEPKSSSSAFWVISGKLVQLPTKVELKACVANMPSLTHATVTGPAVFAALFGDSRKENATLALTQLQESIIDRLATFGAGSLIDADILLLGTSRKRSVRCQTDAMVLELPIAWLQTCLSRLPGAIRAGVISTSRLTVATWMAHCNDKPTISAMLSRNPVLAALSSHAMKALHQHLRPFIFLAGECICSDMYTSSTIFFLQCGRARQEPSNVSFRQRASSIGLNSLVSHQLPRKAGERQKVVANSYCELWGVPLRTVLSLLDEGSKAQCCLRALQLLQFHYTKLDAIACLRRLPVFSYITEPCVKAVAATLSAVVYPPGACVFAGRNKAKCGVFIVSGSARRSLPDSKESAPVDCGVPLSFCETLVGVPTKYTLRTETSCIILYSSRALLLEALSAFPDELQDIYAGAEKAVEGRGLHLTDDQLRAEERIREYVSKMKAKSDQSVESIQTKKKEQLEAMLMAKMEAENLVMSTLALQLNSLVESEVEVHRYNFLRGIEVDAFPEEKVEHPVGPSNQRSCFSIDVKGDVVFLEAGDASPKKPTREPPSPSTQIQANDELEDGQLGQSTFTSAVRGGGHPVGFPSPGLHLFQQPREHVLQLPSLKTELRIHRTVSQNRGKANRAVGLPPRLADVKTAVVHMKDKADGFDAKTAYRQHMLRRKP